MHVTKIFVDQALVCGERIVNGTFGIGMNHRRAKELYRSRLKEVGRYRGTY